MVDVKAGKSTTEFKVVVITGILDVVLGALGSQIGMPIELVKWITGSITGLAMTYLGGRTIVKGKAEVSNVIATVQAAAAKQ